MFLPEKGKKKGEKRFLSRAASGSTNVLQKTFPENQDEVSLGDSFTPILQKSFIICIFLYFLPHTGCS